MNIVAFKYVAGALLVALVAALTWGGVQTLRLADLERDTAIASKAQALQLAAAVDAAAKASAARTTTSESIADTTRVDAQQAVRVEQQTTAASAETVRTIIQRIEVPVGCPTTLPPEVEAEGRAAVMRANGAGR